MKEKVIIDTDVGIDDAMAIFLALRLEELEIVAVTSVFGNSYVSNTTKNALAVLKTAGMENIPVASGAEKALCTSLGPRIGKFHGNDGLGGEADSLCNSIGAPVDISAAHLIQELTGRHPGEITIATLGPLTNIALAVRLRPKMVKDVKRIVVLGGAVGVPGNATPVAEANFYDDPHAAKVVLHEPWDITLVGLNVTTKVEMSAKYISDLCSINNKETQFIGKIIKFYQNAYSEYHGLKGAIYCHDATLIEYLASPKLFETHKIPVFVETHGRCKGMTIPDYSKRWEESANVKVCTKVESSSVLDLYKKRMSIDIIRRREI